MKMLTHTPSLLHIKEHIIPQTIRFGVLSWKKGTRRAGWDLSWGPGARGPDGQHADRELGARGWMGADREHRQKDLRPDTESAPKRRAPGPDTESTKRPTERARRAPTGTDTESPTQIPRERAQRAPGPDTESAGTQETAPTQTSPGP